MSIGKYGEKLKKILCTSTAVCLLGSTFIGTPLALAGEENVEVSISRTYVCEPESGKCTLGNLQISEKDGVTNAISSRGERIEITLPKGITFQTNTYQRAGWRHSDTEYQGMKLEFSGEQTLQVTLLGDNKGVYQDSYALPLYVNIGDITEGAKLLQLNGLASSIASQEISFLKISECGVVLSCVEDFSMGLQEKSRFVIRLTEKVADSIDLNESVMRFTLPSGFAFLGGTLTGAGAFTGSQSLANSKMEWNQLTVFMADMKNIVRTGNERGILELTAEVSTDASALLGPVQLELEGSRNIERDSVIVGEVGNFQIYSNVTEIPEVLSGGVGQTLGSIVLSEEVPNSFVEGSDLRIMLPAGVKFGMPYTRENIKVTHGSMDLEVIASSSSSLTLHFNKVVGSEGNQVEIPLKNVNICADFTGDIQVSLLGRAGVSGTVIVGRAILPAVVSVDEVRMIRKGKHEQAIGTITIEENRAAAFRQGENLVLRFANGIQIDKGYKVEVTEGNLEIGSPKVTDAATEKQNALLTIPIISESSRNHPGKIVLHDVKVTTSSLLDFGAIDMDIMGTAVVQSFEEDWTGASSVWNYHDYPVEIFGDQSQFNILVGNYLFDKKIMDTIQIAYCGEAVQYGVNESRFTIQGTDAIIQGKEETMPVAPYIKDGRTMLPVRYVAYACGVPTDGVEWDAASKRVTLKKDGRDIQLIIGNKNMVIEGDMVQEMEVEPEIQAGYTFLPARYVAEAFGYTVGWDDASHTVTITR